MSKAATVLAVLGLAVGITMLVGIGLFGPRFWAPLEGETEKQVRVAGGEYRIQAYEQFYRWDEKVLSIDVRLGIYTEPMTAFQRTECRGLLHTRAELVAKYNAAAEAEETQGQWRAADLPPRLPQELGRTC